MEENFLTLLDELLDTDTQIEVYNFGIPGAGPAEYLYLYRTEAKIYDPDLVLLCFFIGNDFVHRRKHSILHPERFLSFTVLNRLWAMKGEAPDLDLPDPQKPTFSEEAFQSIEEKRINICRLAPDRKTRKKYEETFQILAEIHEEMDERLRVVIIPDEFQVNHALYRSLVKDREREFDRDLPNQRLQAFFEERGIPYLDLLEVLRESEKADPNYKLRDTHWNRRGNAVAAEAIAKWLGPSFTEPELKG
jgi:hypothetical protein